MRNRHRHLERPIIIDRSNPLYERMHFQMTCEGKKRYDTDWQAKFAADETWERSKHTVDLTQYKCPYCGFWHLTHNN